MDISKYNNVWVSSDWHLFHKNILNYDKNRHFEDVESMSEFIISVMEENIGENDLLIFVGDLALGRLGEVDNMLHRIKGDKIWILGNHDNKGMVKKLSHHFIFIGNKLESSMTHFNHFPPVGYDGMVNYEIDPKKVYIHGHAHQPKQHSYGWDISYDGGELLYNLKDLLHKHYYGN